MKKQGNKRRKNSRSGKYLAALAIFVLFILLLLAAYLVIKPKEQTEPLQKQTPFTATVRPEEQKPVHVITSTSHNKIDTEKNEPSQPFSSEQNQVKSKNRKLAIIVDDMGNSMQEAHSLAAIGVPLTFSIIPGLARFKEVAAFAISQSIEVMIHMPMQSKGWPQRRLESNGLLISMDETAISSQINEYIRLVPGATGANNHMGSEFTEHKDKMRPVLAILKENNLFFIDSVTTPHSTGYRMARELGLRSGQRNVFLDNEQKSDYIIGQLNQAVAIANKHGYAIAICHPHAITISTLASYLPALKQQGITLTSASKILRN